MLTEIYIEVLIVDEDLAHQVWEGWDKGEIDDEVAWLAWWCILLVIKGGDKKARDDPCLSFRNDRN